MTGLCGVLGDWTRAVDRMADDLRWTGEEDVAEYDGEDVAVRSVHHPVRERSSPAVTRNGAFVWVWGDVWGYDGTDGYRSRRESDADTVAGFCARCYEADGVEFAAGLNGNFAVVVYDRRDATAYLLTDRLGTHPVYYDRPDGGPLVFSTRIQSLPLYPTVDAGFDVEYLAEYFALGSVGGVKTPLTDVEELPPSSVTAVDLDTGAVEVERYWRPRFEPLDRPFSYFVDEFVDRFTAALEDRIDPDAAHGLLLSGGSDSRAILAGVETDVDLRTYHTTGWMSREARTAERVAAADDRPFDFLMRDRDSHVRMLDRTPPMMNFQGRFSEAHVAEFADRLRDEVDVLVSGLGADTLFRGHAFPVPEANLGPLGTFDLPLARRTGTVDDHIERRSRPLPDYLDVPFGLDEVLARNIRAENGDGVVHHGVGYRTVDELVFFDDFYPFSNKSDLFYHALNQMAPHWTPFLDNRLVDLALRVPLKHRVRRNLIDAATEALDGRLAAIPHGDTGVPLAHSFPVDYLWHHANAFVWKFLSSDDPPEDHLDHHPWTDMEGLIRTHDFVAENLRGNADAVESLPFLSADGVDRCYRAHLDGADNAFELYTLLSFLNMPVVDRLATSTHQSI